MSREHFFIDPHTWISQVHAEVQRPLEVDEEETERILSQHGKAKWCSALLDETIAFPKKMTYDSFLEYINSPLTDDRVFFLAIMWTRIKICLDLRENVSGLFCRITERDKLNELEFRALVASKIVATVPSWIVPFDEEDKFKFSIWMPTI